MIANSVMSNMNQMEQNRGDQMPPWMKQRFGPNANPLLIQGANMQNNPMQPQNNPFFATPNQIQTFNPFQPMNEIQGQPAMMNQFNPTPINQQPFDMNLNQVQPPQIAPFFHDANQMRHGEASQFRPEIPTVFANNQNDLFPGHVFPENHQNQQAVQPEIGQGAGMMFPPMPNPNQVQMETNLFEPANSASAVGPQTHGPVQSGLADNLDPRIPQPLSAPRAVDNNWSPEVQHWNQEMLQQNQHHFQGMTPEVFAASLNITPDMAPQQPPAEQQQQHQQPPIHPQFASTFNADFNDQGMVFAPPMPPNDPHAIAGNAPTFPQNSDVQVDAPQAHGPPALVPQAPAPAPAQDIPQPSVWDHPLNQQQPEDPPVVSRSEGFGKAK
jgi:hypothetical protein